MASRPIVTFVLILSACGSENVTDHADLISNNSLKAEASDMTTGGVVDLTGLNPAQGSSTGTVLEAGVPDWFLKAMASSDVQVRLRALEESIRSHGDSIEPLILALNDKDERIRARALESIEQDWAKSQGQ